MWKCRDACLSKLLLLLAWTQNIFWGDGKPIRVAQWFEIAGHCTTFKHLVHAS